MHIVFDIGGTNMRIAASQGGEIGEIHKVPTPQDFFAAMREIERLQRTIAGGERIDAAAGCIRGIIDEGVYLRDKILASWEGVRLVDEIENVLHAPTKIVNDCAAIGLGEALFGAGKGADIVAYVTVSTGVGGARIDHGEIDHYRYGFEIGRQLVGDTELEDLVSGTAVRKRFGKEPEDLDSLEERSALADTLAIGLYNTALHWSPDIFILGGSMITGRNPIPLERVSESLARRLTLYPRAPAITMANLGDRAGLLGATALLRKL